MILKRAGIAPHATGALTTARPHDVDPGQMVTATKQSGFRPLKNFHAIRTRAGVGKIVKTCGSS
jgi:hypothetical protein